MKLLTVENAKTVKGETKGYLTFILYLAPARESGYNMCPKASKGCATACLFTAGMGRFDNVKQARIRKTVYLMTDRDGFMSQLVKDIESAIKKAERLNLTPVFRLNGTSDVRWENIPVEDSGIIFDNIMKRFPNRMFYDYTKLPNRRNLPQNYHITFSRSESNDTDVQTVLNTNTNIAVVFGVKKGNSLPDMYLGRRIIDGDTDDLRFLDKSGVIVGLRSKGDAKKDTSGFVIPIR